MKIHGILGVILIILGIFEIFIHVQPFAKFWFFTLSLGFILFFDYLVFIKRKNSLIINRPKKFLGILFASFLTWLIFQIFNFFVKNWYFVNFPTCVHIMDYAMLLPMIFETSDLLSTLKFFDKIKIKKIKLPKSLLVSSSIVGLFLILFIILIPKYFFAFLWVFFILLLDPINYFNKQPSLLNFLEKGKTGKIIALALAGFICGFIWEFGNYYAYSTWYYIVPISFLNTPKIFGLTIFGYPAYFLLSLQFYCIYNFLSLLTKRIRIIKAMKQKSF